MSVTTAHQRNQRTCTVTREAKINVGESRMQVHTWLRSSVACRFAGLAPACASSDGGTRTCVQVRAIGGKGACCVDGDNDDVAAAAGVLLVALVATRAAAVELLAAPDGGDCCLVGS